MCRLVAILFLVGCAHPAPPAKPVVCPPPVETTPVTTPAPPPTKPLDEAQAIARADAFLKAFDTNDDKAFDALTAKAFLWFLHGRTYDRGSVLRRLPARAQAKEPSPVRSCRRHKATTSATAAVVIATCTEQFAAHDDMPAYQYESFINIALVLEDNDWKIAFWTFQTAGLESERDMWNDTLQRGTGFKKTANQHLIDAVKGRKPGAALDIAMGSGRNVLHLAAQGWKVTGVDISEAGIKLATDAATKQKLKFEGVVRDVEKYDLGNAKWDVVTLIYAGTDPKLIARIQRSLKKGGLFIVEFFHKESTAGTGIGGFETGELAKQFTDGWTIVKDEVVEDIADWGLRKTKVVRFTAQKN